MRKLSLAAAKKPQILPRQVASRTAAFLSTRVLQWIPRTFAPHLFSTSQLCLRPPSIPGGVIVILVLRSARQPLARMISVSEAIHSHRRSCAMQRLRRFQHPSKHRAMQKWRAEQLRDCTFRQGLRQSPPPATWQSRCKAVELRVPKPRCYCFVRHHVCRWNTRGPIRLHLRKAAPPVCRIPVFTRKYHCCKWPWKRHGSVMKTRMA
mmetsp:Transcript_29670/g.71303  ORF Transcript_29670/g.71303 Transcript_29670/m.71303 type:complete len:207 (+) Transcript_29670:794-1414(+)